MQVFMLYGQMMRVSIFIVMWNVGVYSGWSYLVPKVLCLNTIKNLMV